MSRSEPEVPSIDTPLAHEAEFQAQHELEIGDERETANAPAHVAELHAEHDLGFEL